MKNKKAPKKKVVKQFRNIGIFQSDYERILAEKIVTNVGIAYIIRDALEIYFNRK